MLAFIIDRKRFNVEIPSIKLSLISRIKVRHDPSVRFKVAHMAKYSIKINENLK